MENKLKRTKQALKKRFNSITFDEDLKSRIYDRIDESNNKMTSAKSRYFQFGLTAGATIFILFCFGIAVQLISDSNLSSSLEEQNMINNQTWPIEDDELEQFKNNLKYEMLNSMDNFYYAKGTIQAKGKMFNNQHINVDFRVGLGRKTTEDQVSYISEYNENAKETKYIVFRDGVVYNINQLTKTVIPKDFGKVFYDFKNQDDSKFQFRKHQPVGIAEAVLFPQEFAQLYLKDNSNWKIKEQESFIYKGRQTVIVYGQVQEDIKYSTGSLNFTSKKGDYFRFWVNVGDGFLVKMEITNSEGTVLSSIEATKFSLQPIYPFEKLDMFDKMLSNYKRVVH